MSKFFPDLSFRIRSFASNVNVKRIASNVSWLYSEQFINLSIGFIFMVWLARYFKPAQFGQYNFVIAYIAIFSAFASFGLESVIVREISKDSKRADEVIENSIILLLIVGVFALIFANIGIAIISPENNTTRLFVFILSFSLLLSPSITIESWFKSQIQAKYIVIVKIPVKLFGFLVKVLLFVLDAPLTAFIYVIVVEAVLVVFGIYKIYERHRYRPKWLSVSWSKVKYLIREGWPLLVSYLSYFVYVRTDQIMLGTMQNDYVVGLYSASYRLYEFPLLLILAITGSLYPYLTILYSENKRVFFEKVATITSVFTAFSYIIVVVTYFIGEICMELIFGQEYKSAGQILTIHIIGIIFMYNAALRSSYLTIASLQKVIMLTSVSAAFINIILNYYLIPHYGAKGAAFATVLTQFLSLLLFNVLFKSSRHLFYMQLKELFLVSLFRLVLGKKANSISM